MDPADFRPDIREAYSLAITLIDLVEQLGELVEKTKRAIDREDHTAPVTQAAQLLVVLREYCERADVVIRNHLPEWFSVYPEARRVAVHGQQYGSWFFAVVEVTLGFLTQVELVHGAEARDPFQFYYPKFGEGSPIEWVRIVKLCDLPTDIKLSDFSYGLVQEAMILHLRLNLHRPQQEILNRGGSATADGADITIDIVWVKFKDFCETHLEGDVDHVHVKRVLLPLLKEHEKKRKASHKAGASDKNAAWLCDLSALLREAAAADFVIRK